MAVVVQLPYQAEFSALISGVVVTLATAQARRAKKGAVHDVRCDEETISGRCGKMKEEERQSVSCGK